MALLDQHRLTPSRAAQWELFFTRSSLPRARLVSPAYSADPLTLATDTILLFLVVLLYYSLAYLPAHAAVVARRAHYYFSGTDE